MSPLVQQFSNNILRWLLTAIYSGNDLLLSIIQDHDNKKWWVEYFPHNIMPIKRYNTAAVTTKVHIIVAGGVSGSNRLDSVEVMDTKTLM